MTKEENYQFWQNHYKIWKEQGVGINSYCKSNYLPPSAFQEWTKKFLLLEDTNYIPETTSSSSHSKIQFESSFSEVKIINNTSSSSIEVESTFGNYKIIFRGFEIQCTKLPEPRWLMELQSLIRRLAC